MVNPPNTQTITTDTAGHSDLHICNNNNKRNRDYQYESKRVLKGDLSEEQEGEE